jgi:hypothetical protein
MDRRSNDVNTVDKREDHTICEITKVAGLSAPSVLGGWLLLSIDYYRLLGMNVPFCGAINHH